MRTHILFFFLFNCLWANSQTIISYQNKGIKCILPTSICEITEVKNASDNHYIGKQIEVLLPFYAFDNLWYSSGIASLVTGEDAKLGPFKMKLISQPYLSAYPSCNPEAETTTRGFGFGKGVQVKILALGSIDKGMGWDEKKFIGKIYTTWGMLMPIGNCWYSGILEKDGIIFLFSSLQVKMVANKIETALQKASEKKVETVKIAEAALKKTSKELPVNSPNKVYKEIRSFSQGMAVVINGDKKYGYVDMDDKLVIPMIYEFATEFKNDYASVKLNQNWGFIDKAGKIIIPFMYEKTGYRFYSGYVQMKLNGKWGFIDDKNKTIVDFIYEDAYGFFEGFAAIKLNNKWGFVDYTGKVVIPLKYEGAASFEDNLAAVQSNGKWGFINKKGVEEIPIIYDKVYWFEKGKVKVVLNDRAFYIDKTGKEVPE